MNFYIDLSEYTTHIRKIISSACQIKAFSLGYAWRGRCEDVKYTDKNYLYFEDDTICYDNTLNSGNNYYTKVTVEKFLDPEFKNNQSYRFTRGDEVLVRNDDTQFWKDAVYSFTDDYNNIYTQNGVMWNQVILYKGNENKLGTK